jgi:hypothetical protein
MRLVHARHAQDEGGARGRGSLAKRRYEVDIIGIGPRRGNLAASRRGIGRGSAAGLPASAFASSDTPISFHASTTTRDLRTGTLDGGAVLSSEGGGAVTLRPGAAGGTWTSPAFAPGFAVNQIVSSWQADTPDAAWIEMHLSVHVVDHWSKWYVMGRWTEVTLRR